MIYEMQPKGYLWCAFMVKLITFFSTKYFFVQHQLVFCRHKILFCATSTFLKKWFASSCNICLFLSTTDYSLCKITLLCFCHFLFFSCNNKFLFWTFFRKLHHGNIFLLSHSNKNTIRSQKKIFFQVMQKKKKNLGFVCITNFLHSTFMLHTGSMLIFFVVILETKNIYFIFSYLLTCLIYGDSY